MNDLDIQSCSRLFWVRNNSVEALQLWEIGKKIRFTSIGFEGEDVRQIEEVDERDKGSC